MGWKQDQSLQRRPSLSKPLHLATVSQQQQNEFLKVIYQTGFQVNIWKVIYFLCFTSNIMDKKKITIKTIKADLGSKS